MDRKALIVQHFTGQDQMFLFISDAPDPAGSRFTPHCDKSERLITDAQVLLEHLPPSVRAHGLHPFQLIWVKERLCRSVTAPVILDVLLPFILVERIRSSRTDVAFDEGREAVVPFGRLAGSVVSGKCLIPQQKTDGKTEKNPERSHYPADLEWNKVYKVITVSTKTTFYSLLLLSWLVISYLLCFTMMY